MPDPLPGIVQGVLPPLFLAILFLLLPFLLQCECQLLGRLGFLPCVLIERNLGVEQGLLISNVYPVIA